MFIRFVVGEDDEHHKSLTGIVTEARLLRDRGLLNENEAKHLEEIYEELNERLPVRPFTNSRWPKDAVAWFKDTAGQPLRYMWDIVALLREHGLPVRMLKSKSPGKVLYEDDYQVVVLEWTRV